MNILVPLIRRVNIPAAFFIAALLASWACWFASSYLVKPTLFFQAGAGNHWFEISIQTLLLVLGSSIPGIATLFFPRSIKARTRFARFLWLLNPVRAKSRYYAVAILCPIAISFLAASLNLFTGGANVLLPKASGWVAAVLLNLPLSPLWEELGWRGFVTSELQKFYSGFRASLIGGILWGFWHAPLKLFLRHDSPIAQPIYLFLLFCIFSTGLAVILSWLFNRTSGALLPVVLFHSIHNTTSTYLIDPAVLKDGLSPVLWASVMVWTFAAAVRIQAGRDLGLARTNNTQTAPMG